MNNKIKMLFFALLGLTAMLFNYSCGNQNPGEELDTPTSGHIKISVDETYKPIIDTEIKTFEGIYTYAKITPSYVTETKAVEDLLNDSARIIIISRELTPKEKKVFDDLKIVPRQLKVAYDAVSLIINKQNTDTLLTSEQVRKIFAGEITTWKQIGGKSGNTNKIQLVFDNSASGNVRFMKEYSNIQKLAGNTFAVNNNESVIDYISKNKDAIGIIGVSWISDEDDSTSLSFLNKIKVMAVAPDDTARGAGDYYQPYQAYIAQKFYPLWRTVYIVSREARSGLGLGFSGFVAGEKGQRIFLKAGLVPATMPVRLVQVRNQKFNVTK